MADATTAGLAAKLTPAVQQFLTDHKADFIAHAGNGVEKLAVRCGLPLAVREAPVVIEHGLEKLAEAMSDWTMHDVAAWLASVAEKKGQPQGRFVREYRSMAS